MPLPTALRVIHSSAWFKGEKLITIQASARIYDPVEIETLIARDPFFGTERASYETIDAAPVKPEEWRTAHGRDFRIHANLLQRLKNSFDIESSAVEDDAALAAFAEKFDARARNLLDQIMNRTRVSIAARAPKVAS